MQTQSPVWINSADLKKNQKNGSGSCNHSLKPFE